MLSKFRLDLERKRYDESFKRFDAISKTPQELIQAKLVKLVEAVAQTRNCAPEEAMKKLTVLQEISESDSSVTEVKRFC